MNQQLNTLEDVIEYYQRFEERATHSDTMKTLSPLEAEWLQNYRDHMCEVIES